MNIGNSIRADDVWSLKAAQLPLPDLLSTVRADVHPPLYFLLLHPWIQWFGPGTAAGRVLSILFHLVACLAVFALGRDLAAARQDGTQRADPAGQGPRSNCGPNGLGLLCASVYAFAPLAVLSAELIRMYSLAGLLSAAAAWFWLRAAMGKAELRHWAGLILTLALGSFAHIWMLCFTCGLAAASIVHFRPRAVKLLAAIATALLPFTFLWLPVLASQVANSSESTAWLNPPSLATVGEVMFLHCGIVLLFLLLFLSPAFRRRAPVAAVPVWTLTIYAATLLPPFAVSFWKPFFFPRFTIVALPALALAAGCLLSRIRPEQLAASIAALGLIFFAGTKMGATRCDAKCASQALVDQVASGDAIIFGSLTRPPVDYYLERAARRILRDGEVYKQSFPSAIDAHPGYEGAHLRAGDLTPLRREAEDTVDSFVRKGIQRVYFLAGYRRRIDAPLVDALNSHYRQLPSLLSCARGDYFTEVLVFERRPAGSR